MSSKNKALFYLSLFVSTIFVPLSAEELTPKPVESIPEPKQFITEHKETFNGNKINYIATAGETYLHDKEGKPKASIFNFAYVKKADKKSTNRPVIFLWNGGPGSASTWLHMGAFGPKRVKVPTDATHPGSPPYPILKTPESLLDVADLVFIDPVGTGYSKALGSHKNKEFWGLTEDANSMAEFIRTWLNDNNRWNSPRFLLGESFGTTRAAAVAKILEKDLSISLNGLIYISQALDYQGSSPYVRDNIISYITYLPTMAATAFYHNKVTPKPDDFEKFLAQARLFATDELLPALFKGNSIDQQTFDAIANKLSFYTGLSTGYIKKANLRINGFRFAKELLRDKGIAVGLLDGRYQADEIDDLRADTQGDASAAISAAYLTGLRDYMRNDLMIDWQRLYQSPADSELSSQWRWRPVPDNKSWEPTYVNTSHDLSIALRANPTLNVFVASGYYDLVTPFFDAEFTLNRHDILSERVQYEYYHGGHMMYVNEDSRIQLLKDIRLFVSQQLK